MWELPSGSLHVLSSEHECPSLHRRSVLVIYIWVSANGYENSRKLGPRKREIDTAFAPSPRSAVVVRFPRLTHLYAMPYLLLCIEAILFMFADCKSHPEYLPLPSPTPSYDSRIFGN